MNDYELYHHGVKGQRWGVRRDKKALASQRKDAVFSRDAIKLYNSNIKAREAWRKRVKDGSRAADELDRQLEGYRRGRDFYSTLSKEQCAELTRQANRLQRKYTDIKIKDVKTETLKTGETAIKKNFKDYLSQDYTYLSMSKRITFDKNGEVTYNYNPQKVTVRTYYY